MIELKLIPDGATKVPAEARDHAILAAHLKNNGQLSSSSAEGAGASSWRDIERVVPGHGEHIAIRVPGEPTDYSDSSLDGFKNAILNNISGLKAHPEGWAYVGRG